MGCTYMFNFSLQFYYERVKHILLLIKLFFMGGVKTSSKCSEEGGAPFLLEQCSLSCLCDYFYLFFNSHSSQYTFQTHQFQHSHLKYVILHFKFHFFHIITFFTTTFKLMQFYISISCPERSPTICDPIDAPHHVHIYIPNSVL